MNVGAARFVSQNIPVGVNVQTTGIVTGDFGGDGKLDLAVATQGVPGVTILQGQGNGRFVVSSTIPLPASGYPVYITTADLNGDGILDLAVTEPFYLATNTVQVLLNQGDGTFQLANPIPIAGNVGGLSRPTSTAPAGTIWSSPTRIRASSTSS